jgi:hypothetical protein
MAFASLTGPPTHELPICSVCPTPFLNSASTAREPGVLANAHQSGQAVAVGIPDDESYFRQRYLPTGRATGWRRGCLIAVIVVVLVTAVALAIQTAIWVAR